MGIDVKPAPLLPSFPLVSRLIKCNPRNATKLHLISRTVFHLEIVVFFIEKTKTKERRAPMNRRRTKTASHWPAAGREPIRKRVVLFFLFFFCCLFWRLAFGCWISGRNTVADNAPLNAAPLTAAHLHRIELSRLLLLFFLARFYRVFARSFFAGCCCCGGGGGCRCCLLSGSWPTALFGTESNSIQRNHRNWIRGDRPMSDT